MGDEADEEVKKILEDAINKDRQVSSKRVMSFNEEMEKRIKKFEHKLKISDQEILTTENLDNKVIEEEKESRMSSPKSQKSNKSIESRKTENFERLEEQVKSEHSMKSVHSKKSVSSKKSEAEGSKKA